jgi:predicted Zn-dependent protease
LLLSAPILGRMMRQNRREKRSIIPIILIAGILIVLFLSLARTENRQIRNLQTELEHLESAYNDRTLYRIEERLKALLGKSKDPRQADRIRFLQGRLELTKALHTPGNLHSLYIDNAISQFRRNISLSTNYLAENLYWLGYSYYNAGENQLRNAQSHLLEALRRGYGERIKIIKLLNNIYLKNRDFQVIIDLNQEFVKKRFFDAEILLSLAQAYAGEGNTKKAQETLGLVIGMKEKPQEKILRDAYFLMAELQYKDGQWRQAAGNYDLCFKVGGDTLPQYQEIRLRYAECLVAIGEVDAAMAVLEDMLKTQPDNRSVSTLHNKLKESKANDF